LVNLRKQDDMTSETSGLIYYKPSDRVVDDIHFGVCVMKACREPQFEFEFPTCEKHSWEIWAKLDKRNDSPQEQALAEDKERAKAKLSDEQFIKAQAKHREDIRNMRENMRTEPGTIYYLQVEDKVKIGFTRDLHMRLMAYPPMARLLATHPGTFQVEADLHKKFASHLAGRKEWFALSDELAAHVEQVRKDFKQDERVAA
jgi:hypothetical protein